MTIGELAKIKNATINDLVEYANGRGLSLSDNPDYQLTESEIKVIDPILSFKLRYKNRGNNIAKIKQITEYVISDNEAIHIDREPKDNEIKTQIDVPKNSNSKLKRKLGFVKFYDSNKGFGFIISNRHLIQTDSFVIDSVYVGQSNLIGCYSLKDGQWVSFDKKKGKRGIYADNVKVVEYTTEDVRLSLKYIGIESNILGYDAKSDYYDVNIFCHIASKFEKAYGAEKLFDEISAFFYGIDDLKKRYKEISLFLSEPKVRTFLLNLSVPCLNDINKNIIYEALETEVSSEPSAIKKWSIFDKWWMLVDFTEEFCDTLANELFKVDNNIDEFLTQSDEFIRGIITRAGLRHMSSEKLKTIYLTHPSKIELFLPNENNTPFEKGLIYLAQGNQNDFVDSDTFTVMISEPEIIKPFLSKYFSVNRENDLIFNNVDRCSREKIYRHLSHELIKNLPTDVRFECFVTLKDFIAAGGLAKDNIDNDPFVQNIYNNILSQNHADKISIGEFRDFIRLFTLEQVQGLTASCVFPKLPETFVKACLANFKTPIWGNQSGLSNDYYIQSYIYTNGEPEYLLNTDTSSINQWLSENTAERGSEFISILIDNNIEILESTNIEYVVNAIKILEDSVQLECINKLPLHLAKEIVSAYFGGTELQEQFMHDQWENLKLSVPHITFDIESDGEEIKEFAFRFEENTRLYNGQQIKSLIRRLNDAKIIVGHNVKEWDLPILSKYDLKVNGFIWDTLEIELLLNPCRYAYSLHTTHIAKEDTELTDRLFWNQLLRLSINTELCESLREYLPEQLVEYLQLIQDPYFKDYLLKEAGNGYQFFQELIPIDKSLVKKLNDLNEQSKTESILIIAPKDIWPRLAQHLSLNFPTSVSPSFQSIDASALTPYSINDYMQLVLRRFMAESETPVIANIPQYLRSCRSNHILYLPDELLKDISRPSNGRIDCIDFGSFEKTDKLKNSYSRIVTIGGELYDRIHKVQIGDTYDSLSPNIILSKLFFSMASCNYAKVPSTDLERFGIVRDDLTASIWAERDSFGKISIFKNFKFKLAKERFLSHFRASCERIEWRLQGQKSEAEPIIVTVKLSERSNRLAESTTLRSNYWASQFGIIAELKPQMPIVYVVNNTNEISPLIEFAKRLGYYIPEFGSGFRKLEYIGSRSKSMVIITKEQFISGISEYRTNIPYCYIWDNMDIERLKLMWDVLPFENDIVEDGTNERDSKSGRITSRKCIIAAWPVMNHYCSLIRANSRDSQMYVIDSHFDENLDVADICGCNAISIKDPAENDAYSVIENAAADCFENHEYSMPELDTEQAMEAIRRNFIPDHKWHDYQRNILPAVLNRDNDLLISLPTGGGKSILFQGPAIYRAASSHKLSIVISPLRALMQDQIEELIEKGFGNAVDYISGDRTYPEVQNIYRRIRGGEIALLYITPERFRVRSFTNALHERLENDGGLEYVVFDEAHCISQWGQEFRPDYRNAILECSRLRNQYDIKICLLSATVTSQIEDDIRKFLPEIQRLGQSVEEYNPVRQHIGISFKLTEHEDERRIDEICDYIASNNIDFRLSRMIIFCRTHSQCEDVSSILSERFLNSGDSLMAEIGNHISYFHAGMDADQRNDVYSRFKGGVDISDKNEEVYILCATKAFGMGMDIPNIHYVLHFSPPSVMEDYLQEVGRAGRNADMYQAAFAAEQKIPAQCLVSMEDFRKLKELLIKSMMSWSDIEKAREKIIEYISRFKDRDAASQSQTVVPFDVWSKDETPEKFNDTTVSRLAFHWLEHLNLISLGYLDQACMDVTMLKPWSPIGIKASNRVKEKIANALKIYCKDIGSASMLPIKGMRECTGQSWPKIADVLLQAQQRRLLVINDTIRCAIKPRRTSEIKYMLETGQNVFALHIIVSGMQLILSQIATGNTRVFETEEILNFVKHLTDEVSFATVKEKNRNGEEIEYMPWGKSDVRMDVTHAKTFKKEIISRSGPKIFLLLNHIPGVSSVAKRENDGTVNYTITVHHDKWKEFLPNWEKELFSILEYISGQDMKIVWSQMILDLEMFIPGVQGYSHFENSLSILKSLQYIDYTPLVRSGIEVQPSFKAFEPIDDGTDDASEIYPLRQEFDQEEKIKKIRLSAMDIFSKVDSERRSDYIRRYFQCRSYDEFLGLVGDFCPDGYSDILSELSEEALSLEEEKLQYNVDQMKIYNCPVTQNINILAGPGSGKTHVLTLRCAKLVYREHVDPSHILVLAYNRAVVVELKNRLNRLFRKLGLSRMAHQMHVYTFHALAKVVLGSRLDNVDTKEWESRLCEFIEGNRNLFKSKFPNIEHVLIDEFQDITESRLKTISLIHDYYPDARFFTIGDINQSIYGFDRVAGFNGIPEQYAHRMKPLPYYDKLRDLLNPVELSMFTNYRSYQKILDKAADFIPADSELPRSATSIMEHEPQEEYVHESFGESWFSKLPAIIENARFENANDDTYRRIDSIAIFFRTNNEVYRGFSQIKKLNLDASVRVRIQGTSSFELWRQREMYHIISYFSKSKDPNTPIILKNNETKNIIRNKIEQYIKKYPNWDAYYLDVTFTLILHYLELIRTDEQTHTYGELAEFIKDIAGNDDGGQVFKIYDEYETERIFKDKQLTIILTTMHKVKGLEFDVVVVTPSFANLPLRPHRQYQSDQVLLEDDKADIEEEKRLRFVAYTRARKWLYIFNSKREEALVQNKIYNVPKELQSRLGITEKEPRLRNYNLGYHSNNKYNFDRWNDLLNIPCNSPVRIERKERTNTNGERYESFEIIEGVYGYGRTLGVLSSSSSIKKQMIKDNITTLRGLFVSDIFAWEYNDSLRYDEMHRYDPNFTPYSPRWIPKAKEQGYVYIVNISGFGIKID